MKVDKVNFRSYAENSKPGFQTQENDPEEAKRKEDRIFHSFCSFQSRMGPPEYRKWRRIHGLQLPLHPQQVVGWMILIAVGAATFFVLIPALQPLFQETVFVILAILFSLHILSHLTALLLDPADPELRALKVKFVVPEFDRSKHAHVIENGRCHLCNIKTSGPKTKHCSVCNKCIDNFDHHCKWLNHCIGGRNYKAFLVCVVSAVAASLVVVGVSVLEIVYYHVDPGLLNVFSNSLNGTSPELFLPESVFLGIVSMLGLLAAATAGLLLHLCLFHCYISVLGITTYEYIRNYRQETSTQRLNGPFNCKKSEVLTNNVGSPQKTRLKFQAPCSRSFEDGEENKCCSCAESSFHRTKHMLTREEREKKRLERQNTDPEFVDRVIKPFLITLSDEKNFESTTNSKQIHSLGECRCGCAKNHDKNSNVDTSPHSLEVNRNQNDKGLLLPKLKSWKPKILRSHSASSGKDSVKVKCNQIRPSTADELNRKGSRPVADFKPERLDLKSFTTMKTKVLPELTESLKRVQSSELRELNSVLDLVDQSNFVFQLNMKTNHAKGRKKNVIKRPRSPPLSPIRESGLSNPGSPRVDIIMPPTPIFVRPSTPETSTIFLSNSNSSSSSSYSSSEDEEDIALPPVPFIHREYNGKDILKTPQLPRKTYSSLVDEPIFILKPSKLKSSKWIDVKIQN